MIYFFVQHKVHRIPGGTFSGDTQPQCEYMFTPGQLAYTRYAFFEWSLIVFDILYDSVAIIDFGNSGIEASTVHQRHLSRGFSPVRYTQASLAITITFRNVQDATGQDEMNEMYYLLRR